VPNSSRVDDYDDDDDDDDGNLRIEQVRPRGMLILKIGYLQV
jgi:hypothetical protein